MEAKDLAQALILNILIDERRHRLLRLQAYQIRHNLDHIRELCEWLIDQFKAFLIDLFTNLCKAQVAIDIGGIKTAYLAQDVFLITIIMKDRTILKTNIIKGVNGDQ